MMADKKAEIYRCGKTLFSEQGFKKTNVSQITEMAGMATGTFYLYYQSKEALFMDIYMDENEKLKRANMEGLDVDGDPLAVIQEVMQRNTVGMKANPILREWYNKDVFSKIEKKFKEQKGLERVDFVYDTFFQIIRKWQADGKMRDDMDTGMIMALFAFMIVIDLHKEEIGVQYFPEIQDILVQFIMDGLRRPSDGE